MINSHLHRRTYNLFEAAGFRVVVLRVVVVFTAVFVPDSDAALLAAGFRRVFGAGLAAAASALAAAYLAASKATCSTSKSTLFDNTSN